MRACRLVKVGKENERMVSNENVLPPLPVEFHKDYVVDVDTIRDEAYALFRRSGYTLWHRPNICLQGYTRKRIIVNPYEKSGTDAAKEGAPYISFDEFLKLFEIAETNSSTSADEEKYS